MAVGKGMQASQRRLVFGANVVLTVALAALGCYFAIWLAARVGGRLDLSSSGVNSLSLRTTQLLRSLDTNVQLTALYTTALKELRKHAEKYQAHVGDLLDLYETAGRGKVHQELIDPSKKPAAVAELLKRLADKPEYKDEAAPHAEALEAFPELNQRIAATAQAELDQLSRMTAPDQPLSRVRELAIITRNFRALLSETQRVERDVSDLRGNEVPLYGEALKTVRDHYSQARAGFQTGIDWLTGPALQLPELPPEAADFFAGAKERYQPLIQDLDTQLTKTQDLGDVKLEELYETLKRGQSIVVETPTQALVLSQEDVWPFRTDSGPPAPDGDLRRFAGEQAVSSAILQLTRQDKTGVVFVRYGGQPLLKPDFAQMNPMLMKPPDAAYGVINTALEKENFVTAEWDVHKDASPPDVKDATRLIYVVFPPNPPPRGNPMQPAATPGISPQQKQAVIDAVKASGMGVFLTSWEPPQAQFVPTPPKYEFLEYLRDEWGVNVEYTHLTVEFMPNPQREGVLVPANRDPLLITSGAFEWTDQSIAAPLHALPGAFKAVAPLEIRSGDDAVQGVKIEPIALLKDSDDIWAFSDFNRVEEDFQKRQGTRRYEGDIPAPFPLALTATREDGKKLVVFASKDFIANNVLELGQLVVAGGVLQLAQSYPANTDVFVNALHWLTGDADRIAVGPRDADVPRLDKLTEEDVTFARVFLVGIWPAIALLAGAAVWLVRRR